MAMAIDFINMKNAVSSIQLRQPIFFCIIKRFFSYLIFNLLFLSHLHSIQQQKRKQQQPRLNLNRVYMKLNVKMKFALNINEVERVKPSH